MQEAQVSSSSQLNKVAKLLEQVFQRYEHALTQDDSNISLEDLRNILFRELDALIGEVLAQALRVLDQKTIIVYSAIGHKRQVAEILSAALSLLPSVYLYPGVNYCQCYHFSHCVLGLPESQIFPSPKSGCSCGPSYTCAHVVALRLAQSMKLSPPTLRFIVLSEDSFRMVLKQMQSIDEWAF